DGVRLSALDVDDEADAAGVVLVSGIVQGLRLWHTPSRGHRRPLPGERRRSADGMGTQQANLKREPTPSDTISQALNSKIITSATLIVVPFLTVNLDTLQLSCDVVRLRSFSRGAAAQGISQSAASQSIQQLE